ncbi:MAG: FAD-binding protein, partial [Panacibacter sp.]
TNGHENFTQKFKKGASFKLVLPDSLTSTSDQYKATTANFMWLIQYALDNNIQLRAMGNGWSFSEIAVCNDGVVDTKSLRLSFAVNNSFVAPEYLNSGKQSSDLFLVQCGMSIMQLEDILQERGRSPKASGASNMQTIAGATSTGTHGSAYRVGAVHDSIVGLHIITGANKHVWLEKKSNPVASDEFMTWLGAEKISDDDDVFNAAVVSFGGFGFIHGILLETEPLFLLEEQRIGEITYDDAVIKAIDEADFSAIADKLPYPEDGPDKSLYHFEMLLNPHDFEAGNPDKGVYFKLLYKMPYTSNYTKRERDIKGLTYGQNTLGLVQTILDALGTKLAAALVPTLVNTMMPLAFKPVPAEFGTLGETFSNTKFRGKAASGAIGINRSDASKVIAAIIEINKRTPFPGALALRFVKGTQALLGFTKFPATCILEMDGVDANITKDFFQQTWNRLESLGIPYTLHWGKFNFNLNAARVRNMYSSDKVDQWLSCRHQVLDENVRKIFTNDFMVRCGLDV